jgi:peptidoglycan/xylan/chitin deacetylase (PgdA/CDA1 family)
MKHRLKLLLRGAYARALYHLGLHRLVNRLMPPRLTILAGHCVDAPEHNGFLPKDMKIRADKLEDLLRWFLRRGYGLCTVGDGVTRISNGPKESLLALSMDDGYRDNATVLLPLLRRIGVPATVFLESRPLDERRVSWSHKYLWILNAIEPAELARRYVEKSADEEAKAKLHGALEKGGDAAYHVKRVLKYDADPDDRDRVIDALFAEVGGDERALCESLYMSWDDARLLQRSGVELGGHTVSHHVLSTLDAKRAQEEVAACRRAMEGALGRGSSTFAYPFGRRWDFDDDSVRAVEQAGYACAVTTHAGTNDARTDRMRLKRLMIDEDVEPHLVVAEACGGFDLLRKLGLDWSE